MPNAINQNKKMTACILTAIRAIFLFAILFAVCLSNIYAQNTWTKKADCGGLGRWEATGFSIGSKGYIGTGINGTSVLLNDFWEYDPSTNVWTQKADFGGGLRFEAVGLSIGSKGYIGTGINGTSNFLSDFWEYDPSTNVWTRKADFGGTKRRQPVGFSIGSKGYIGTGGGDFNFEKDFWEYDPATDVWTKKADFGGGGRLNATGFSIGSKGYLGTGDAPGGNYYSDFWEYDPATDTWARKADFAGGGRHSSTAFSIGSKGYMGTGGDGPWHNDFWEYDPATNTWTRKADFGGGARDACTGFSIGNKGYIGTGVYPVGYKDFWEYTPGNGCPAPTNLRVTKLSDTSAVLKWETAGADVLHVRVRYRTVGSTTWTIKNKNVAYPSVHTDRLTPNTTYQWQARSFCADDTTGWVAGPDFTTAASLNPGAKATAYPNPAKNTVTVNYSVTGNGKYIFEITNASGNVVMRKEAKVTPGANHITLDISRFFKGVYFINLIKPDMTREKIQLNKE